MLNIKDTGGGVHEGNCILYTTTTVYWDCILFGNCDFDKISTEVKTSWT